MNAAETVPLVSSGEARLVGERWRWIGATTGPGQLLSSARKGVSGYKINLSKRFRRKDYPAAVRWAARRLAHQA